MNTLTNMYTLTLYQLVTMLVKISIMHTEFHQTVLVINTKQDYFPTKGDNLPSLFIGGTGGAGGGGGGGGSGAWTGSGGGGKGMERTERLSVYGAK